MNEQNNNTSVTPITPITPIQPQVNGSDDNLQATPIPVTNSIPATVEPSSSSDGKIDVVNPVPMTGADGKIDVVNPVPAPTAGGSTVLMPTTSLPEVKGADNTVSVPNMPATSTDTTASSSQLNLENSSPFDIGVNGPVSTNVPGAAVAQGGAATGTTATVSSSPAPDINITQNNNASGEVLSFKTYLINMLLFSIPIIGFIILIIKILNKNNKSISDFAKAFLLYVIIIFVVYIIFLFVLGMIGASMMDPSMYY